MGKLLLIRSSRIVKRYNPIGLAMNMNVLTILGFLLGVVFYKRFLKAS